MLVLDRGIEEDCRFEVFSTFEGSDVDVEVQRVFSERSNAERQGTTEGLSDRLAVTEDLEETNGEDLAWVADHDDDFFALEHMVVLWVLGLE